MHHVTDRVFLERSHRHGLRGDAPAVPRRQRLLQASRLDASRLVQPYQRRTARLSVRSGSQLPEANRQRLGARGNVLVRVPLCRRRHRPRAQTPRWRQHELDGRRGALPARHALPGHGWLVGGAHTARPHLQLATRGIGPGELTRGMMESGGLMAPYRASSTRLRDTTRLDGEFFVIRYTNYDIRSTCDFTRLSALVFPVRRRQPGRCARLLAARTACSAPLRSPSACRRHRRRG